MRKIETIAILTACISLGVYNIVQPRYIEQKQIENVPIHAVARSYNNELKIPKISKELETQIEQSLKRIEENEKKIQYEKDLYYLTAVIYQEAGGDKYQDITQLLVGNVVLNRVNHKDYADSIKDVLLSKHQYGNMWRHGIYLPNNPNDLEKQAIQRCRKNAIRLLNGERFCPSNVVFESEFSWLGDGIYKYIDGLYFNYKK